MCESQSLYVVHTYNALKRGQFDSIVHFWLFEFIGDVSDFCEVYRSIIFVFQIRAGLRSGGTRAEQAPALVVVIHQGCRLGGRRRNPPPFAGIGSRSRGVVSFGGESPVAQRSS